MGFTACGDGSGCVIQIYDFNYEKLQAVHLGMTQIFTDISLCIDDQFLVGSHIEGYASVINLSSFEFEIVEKPFGDV